MVVRAYYGERLMIKHSGIGLIAAAAVATSASAYDLSKTMSKEPEHVVVGRGGFYAAERCILTFDGGSQPGFYRAPDRPNESLIYYNTGTKGPILFRLTGDATAAIADLKVEIWSGSKWKDRIQNCVNGATSAK